MEIGVLNGENAVSMLETAIRNHPTEEVEYYGFDFFSRYSTRYVEEKLESLGCKIHLYKGNTVDTIPSTVYFIPFMDLIFIDGGKSYDVASSDWKGASKLMHRDTGVFVHNVGFHGVGRMVENIDQSLYRVEIFYPPYEGKTAFILRS